MTAQALLDKFPIITDQVNRIELSIILQELNKVLINEVTGDIVEFGCYAGTTSLFIQRMIKNEVREFHVYDSFAGLPEKSDKDETPLGYDFSAGQLHASKQTFIHNFKRANLQLPIIHKNWFHELKSEDIPKTIAFAFLDGDYYESINTSLKLIDNNLSRGAVIIVDDYMNEALPGAKKAVDEWCKKHRVRLRTEASLAIMYID